MAAPAFTDQQQPEEYDSAEMRWTPDQARRVVKVFQILAAVKERVDAQQAQEAKDR